MSPLRSDKPHISRLLYHPRLPHSSPLYLTTNSLVTWYLLSSIYSVSHCLSLLHLCFYFPTFCFSHFLFLVFTLPLFPPEWQRYIEQEVKVWRSLSFSLSPLLHSSSSTPPLCCRLCFYLPVSVFLDESPHLFISSPLFTYSISIPLLTPPPFPSVHRFYCFLQLMK